MSDFTAKITADISEAKSKIQELANTNLTLNNIKPNTANLIQQIQAALNSHQFNVNVGLGKMDVSDLNNGMKSIGASAGKVLSDSVSSALSNASLKSDLAKLERDNAKATYEALKSSNNAKVKEINRAYQQYQLADKRYTEAYKAEQKMRINASNAANKQSVIDAQAAAKEQAAASKAARDIDTINAKAAAKEREIAAATASKKETAAFNAGIKERDRLRAKEEKTQERLTKNFGSPINMGNFSDENAKKYIGLQEGISAETVKAAGAVQDATGSWHKYEAEVRKAGDTMERVSYYFNPTTGETRRKSGGIYDVPPETSQYTNERGQLLLGEGERNYGQPPIPPVGNLGGRGSGNTGRPNTLYGMTDEQFAITGRTISDTGWAIERATSAATRFIALPIAAAAVASTKAFMDYETAFTQVRKTVDGTDEELQAVSDGIQKMALRVPVASTELAGIAHIGGQLGVPTEKLLGFTEAYAALEVATNLQGDEGAATLARFMNVMDESYDNVQNVGSAIVDLGNHTATTENEITQMATRMGSTASILGMSTADVLGYSAALSSLGVRAEAGGSSMMRILQKVDTAVSEGGDALDTLAKKSGVSASEFAKSWKEAPTETFNMLLKGLSESSDIIGDLGDLGIKNVRDIQAIEKLAGRYDLLTDSINRSREAYGEATALQVEADRAYNTTASRLQLAKESIVQAARGIGGAIAPVVVDIAKGVASAATSFSQLDEGVQKFFIKNALAFAGEIFVLNGVGKTLTTIGNAMVALDKIAKLKGFAGVATMFSSLGATATPILGAAAAIGVLAIAGKKLYDNWYHNKYNWGEDVANQASKVKENLENYKKIYDLQKDFAKQKQIIESPTSSQSDIDAAKSRIKEIADMLNEEYNLHINVDDNGGFDKIKDTIDALERQNRAELNRTNHDLVNEIVEHGGSEDVVGSYRNSVKELNNLHDANKKLEQDYDKLFLIWTDAQAARSDYFGSDKTTADQEIFADKMTSIIDRLRSGGFTDIADDFFEWSERIKSGAYQPSDFELTSNLVNQLKGQLDAWNTEIGNNKQHIEEYQTSISQLNDSIHTLADGQAYLLKESLLSGNKSEIETAQENFIAYGKSVKDAGASTEYMATQYAIAKQGLSDFNEVLERGAASATANDFMNYQLAIGKTAQEAVRGAAMIKNGFDDATKISKPETFEAIFQDMVKLGQEHGLADSVKNAVEQTALLKSGFNDVSEVIVAGDTGIQTFAKNLYDLSKGKIEGFPTDTGGASSELTQIARQMGMIPDNKQIRIDVDGNVEVIEDIASTLDRLYGEGKQVALRVDTSGLDAGSDAFNKLQAFDGKVVTATMYADGTPAEATIEGMHYKIADYNSATGTATLIAETGEAVACIDFVTGKITAIPDKEVEVQYNTDTSGIQQPNIPPASGEVNYSVGSTPESVPNASGTADYSLGLTPVSAPSIFGMADYTLGSAPTSAPGISGVASYSGIFPTSAPTLHGTIVYSAVYGALKGKSVPTTTIDVNGTANVNGSTGNAFKSGNWGKEDSGMSLGGELGRELLVRNGRWYTIGDTGAEFFNYRKGDIIFNHIQTKELFEHGRVISGGGRGRAFAKGTSNTPKEPTYFDWAETALDRIGRVIEHITSRIEDTFVTFDKRLIAITEKLPQLKTKRDWEQQAYDMYISEANKVGLDEDIAAKVRDGSFDISAITDESLQKKISKYKEWYEKALDCQKAIDELNKSVKELYQTAFDYVVKEHENILGRLENRSNLLKAYLEKAEERGYSANGAYYQALVETEEGNIAYLKNEQKSLYDQLNMALDAGEIELYSEAWDDMQSQIDEVTTSIVESEKAVIEYKNALRELEWDAFDRLQERFSDINSEAKFLIDLLDNKNAYDNRGILTNKGQAILGLRGVNYNAYMEQAKKYADEITKINNDIAANPEHAYDNNLIDRRRELLDLQRDAILAAKDEKDAIVDLVQNGYDSQLNSMSDVIDKYKDALRAEKDLFSYERNIRGKANDIASIQKQLAAYANDTSEEAKARVQKLQSQLADAQDDLEDAQYDKYISDQESLLDAFYDEYKTDFDDRLKDTDKIIEDVVKGVNDSSDDINRTISTESHNVGYTLTNEMGSIWTDAKMAISDYKDAVTPYLTSVHTVLTNIESKLNSISAYQSDNAEGGANYATSNPYQATGTPKVEGAARVIKFADGHETVFSGNGDFISAANAISDNTSDNSAISVGGLINAGNAKIYSKKGGLAIPQYFKNDPIYTVLEDDGEYLKVRYHNATGGVTGYFKKSDVKAYKKGGLIDYTGLAWVDGSKNQPEAILSAEDTANMQRMFSDEFIKAHSALSFGDKVGIMDVIPATIKALDVSKRIKDMVDDKHTNTFGDINVTYDIDIDHVDDYNDLMYKIQEDSRTHRMLTDIVQSQMLGKSSKRSYYRKN